MQLPSDFVPLIAVVSDWHCLSPVEKSLYFYLKENGFRHHLVDKLWDRVFQVFEAEAYAQRTLKALNALKPVPHFVSLGDFFVTVNELGLAAQWTRLAGLWLKEVVTELHWPSVTWVPGDHDLGVRHRLTTSGERPRLHRCQREFERETACIAHLEAALQRHPEHAAVLGAPTSSHPEAGITSLTAHEQLLGPLWGRKTIAWDDDELHMIWLSDVLIERYNDSEALDGVSDEVYRAAAGQQEFIENDWLADPPLNQWMILCVHDPGSLRLLSKSLPKQQWPLSLILILCGHRHWAPRGGLKKVGGASRIICPNVAGLRGVPGGSGGGLVIGEHASTRELGVFRYNVERNTYQRLI